MNDVQGEKIGAFACQINHGGGPRVVAKAPMVRAKAPGSSPGRRLDRRERRLRMGGTLMQAKVTLEKVPRFEKLPEGRRR